jgi:hypothetical protein
MRLRILLGATAAATLFAAASARDARACGGCFHEPNESGTVITDHRMVFSVTPEQTTLYDEIEYMGSPQSFAWVLPIHGTVTVGLSSDVVFGALEQVTQTHIVQPNLPPCPQPPSCYCGGSDQNDSPGFGGGGAADASAKNDGVTVTGQAVVGPYDTVQLHSTDPNALNAWLSANNYVVPSDVQPIIAAYVSEGFDFLALRLAPGQGVSAMRPVRVTSTGAGLSLPLRMVSAGAGATLGITLWVVGQGRYEPQNFPNFTIDPSIITWDFTAMDSDYTTIRAAKEQAANYGAWQIESSLDVSPFQIENPVLRNQAANDYSAVPPSDAGPGETADQVRMDDLAALFGPNNQGSMRITRMRADLAHSALATDLALQASADQSAMSNVYEVTKYIHAPTCPAVPPMTTCPPCPNDPYGYGNPAGGNSNNNGSQSFGCTTAAGEESSNWALEAGALAFACAAFMRARAKRNNK